jgi:hypothetical protein
MAEDLDITARRNEAIEERDSIITWLTEMGVALGRGWPARLHSTADGVELRLVYASQTEALAAEGQLRALCAMAALSGGAEEARH